MRLFKIPIKVDLSWLFIFTLVVWSLAGIVFPNYCRDYPLSRTTYWIMGLVGGLGVFSSILCHELCHAVVAKRYGVNLKRITLFVFGGVAEIEDEPPSSRAEFWMAAAGPLFSFITSALFFGLGSLSEKYSFPIWERAVVNYLAWGNFALASFNLLPAFPLDGGRILRAYLWGRKRSIVEATRIASKIGSGFGMALMILGVVTFLFRNFVGGMWYFLIGMFLKEAAQASYQQVLLKTSFEGELVSRFMKTNPVAVQSNVTLKDFLDHFLIRYQFRMFPVVDADQLVGCIGMGDLKKVARSDWNDSTVKEHMQPISARNSIAPDADARQAFIRMNQEGEDRLLVVEQGHLVGVLALKDMLEYFALVFDFEWPEKAAA